ncbi:MAG: hypothetical protein ACKOA5_00920 [Actinomycetota bacterium]
MYESLLESALIVRLLVVVVPILAIVVPCARGSLRNSGRGVDDDSVMSAAAGFVGAAFIFIGSFANVTAWQGAGDSVSSLKRELSSLATLSESILDYQSQPVLTDAIHAVNKYVETVRDVELNHSANDGAIQSASADERTHITKNAALGLSASKSNEVEQAALDIRSAVLDIEKADVVNERDLDRMLNQVAEFQDARRDRISATWPLVSDIVMIALLLVTIATAFIIGLYPSGKSSKLKWLQVTSSSVVVGAVWFAVLSTQNLTMSNSAISGPIKAFLARYK